MDVKTFLSFLNSKHFPNMRKLALDEAYKDNFSELLDLFKELMLTPLPLNLHDGTILALADKCISVPQSAVKSLMIARNSCHGIKCAEEEIISSAALEKDDYDAGIVLSIARVIIIAVIFFVIIVSCLLFDFERLSPFVSLLCKVIYRVL